MIIANIKNAERYYSLNPLFKEIFDFLGTLNEDSAEGTQREGWRAGVSVCEKRDYDVPAFLKNSISAEQSSKSPGSKSNPGFILTLISSIPLCLLYKV